MAEKKTVEEFIAEQRDALDTSSHSECGMTHYQPGHRFAEFKEN